MDFEQTDEVDEILAQHARPHDPENCTVEDMARLFGGNWRDAVTVIRQAADLTYEQAEKIAGCPLDPNWELFQEQAYNAVLAAGLANWANTCVAWEAATIERPGNTWERIDNFNHVYDAFICAITAAMAGDSISEWMHRDLMHAWRTAF
jgi:hypothetical protein